MVTVSNRALFEVVTSESVEKILIIIEDIIVPLDISEALERLGSIHHIRLKKRRDNHTWLQSIICKIRLVPLTLAVTLENTKT